MAQLRLEHLRCALCVHCDAFWKKNSGEKTRIGKPQRNSAHKTIVHIVSARGVLSFTLLNNFSKERKLLEMRWEMKWSEGVRTADRVAMNFSKTYSSWYFKRLSINCDHQQLTASCDANKQVMFPTNLATGFDPTSGTKRTAVRNTIEHDWQYGSQPVADLTTSGSATGHNPPMSL